MSSLFMNRRRSLLALCGVAASASSAFAADEPVGQVPQTGIQPPTVPIAPVVSSTLNNNATDFATKALGKIDKDKAYYIFFQQQIDIANIKNLRATLVALVEAGVSDMTLVLSSSGGLVPSALSLSNLLLSLPVPIKIHGQGLVGSAANLIFLAGHKRTADRNCQFFFHPVQAQVIGMLTAQQMEEQMLQMSFFTQTTINLLRERSKVPAADIETMQHKAVVYTAEQALKYELIEAAGPMKTPPGEKCKFVFIDNILTL
jgi:ATP-dependent protease ClpP protease subunit